MESTFSFIDAIIIVCGLYITYSAYLLKFRGILKDGIIVPKGTELKKCKDKERYINEMCPKTFFYGGMVILCGALGVLDDMYHFMNQYYIVSMVVFLGITIWFAIIAKKTHEKYWK